MLVVLFLAGGFLGKLRRPSAALGSGGVGGAREVAGSVSANAVRVPESRNMSGLMAVLSTPIFMTPGRRCFPQKRQDKKRETSIEIRCLEKYKSISLTSR